MRNTAPLPPAVTAPRGLITRDFSKAKPVSDDVFRLYRGMYAYDRTPLHERLDSSQNSTDWRMESVSFDAAYGRERVPAFLFVPTHVRPPYQAVVYFPTAKPLFVPDSKDLTDLEYFDFVIKSGRAVLYPVYQGTYERHITTGGPDTHAGLEMLIQQSKDVGRSVDYLETRADIDRNKIAYLGFSYGGAWGVIFASLEDRFKTAVLLSAGFFNEKMLPGGDQVDFAPRLTKPVLMVNGKYDSVFMGDQLFPMLGTPKPEKRFVILEADHDINEQRPQLVREVVGWLDRYLGKVN